MDAGENWRDYLAREAQTYQLARVIDELSWGKALIVGGDWNLTDCRREDQRLMRRFRQSLSLLEVKDVLGSGPGRVDRILFRSGEGADISPAMYRVELDMFRDEAGNPLSDHDAVSVDLELRVARNLFAASA
jgi:hypothetical protein